MARAALYITSLFLAFVGLVWISGLLLPAQYMGKVSGQIDAPAETVWARLHDLNAIPLRHPEIIRVEKLENTQSGIVKWSTVSDSGVHAVFESQDDLPNRKMIVRMTESSQGLFGVWEYQISGNEMTLLTITEKSETSNIFQRALAGFGGRDARLKKEFKSLQNVR